MTGIVDSIQIYAKLYLIYIMRNYNFFLVEVRQRIIYIDLLITAFDCLKFYPTCIPMVMFHSKLFLFFFPLPVSIQLQQIYSFHYLFFFKA